MRSNRRMAQRHERSERILKKPEICRYCGGIVRLVPASGIYGKTAAARLGLSREYLYQCQNCGARVGCHRGTTRPLGNVANEALRSKRIEAHRIFDGYWRHHRISRSTAYSWLAKQMGLPRRKTHIGSFEMDQCQRVIRLCTKQKEEKAT